MVESEEIILGSFMSSLHCDNEDFFKQYADDIDECNNFVRVEECNHYRVNMTRTRIKDNIIIIYVKFECAKCNKEQERSSQNIEGKFEFECCDQKKIIYSYSISFNENNFTQIKEREDDDDKYIDNIDEYPWPNIADDNRIVLIFKYLKKTNVHYKMHCSKENSVKGLLGQLLGKVGVAGTGKQVAVDQTAVVPIGLLQISHGLPPSRWLSLD